MAQQHENLDFSSLFKLDVLIQLNIKCYSFYELGLKKFLAFSNDEELHFIYINPQLERTEKNYDWDFFDNPVFCMCFEPSGTWVTIISEDKVLLVPYLPLYIPQNAFDCKWSLSSVTVLPLGEIPRPTSVVWWLTKDSENILIIGTKSGSIVFYSMESQVIMGEAKVSSEIVDLQICYDDSLDLLTLLITGDKNQYWKLVLEHRSYDYNWLQQIRLQSDRDKKDFMSYIKQLSKDKITFFSQGGSKDEKQPVEYVLKPTEYLPVFRKSCNSWSLTAQYVNGRHFLSAYELNEGTLILESPEESMPSRVLRPQIQNDGTYLQGLWSQRLIYLLKKNKLEVHSTSFSVIQGEAPNAAKKEYSILWSVGFMGDAFRAHLMTAKEPNTSSTGWKEPTFLCDLQLPRFSLEHCLIITSSGAYVVNISSDPCEWLVGAITRGGAGAEQAAAALGAPVPTLLKASADLLLARGKLPPAQYLYFLSQSHPDGWLARLGVFGKLQELTTFKQASNNVVAVGNAAIIIKLLATLLSVAINKEIFDTDVRLSSLNSTELSELCTISASIGLWSLVPTFSIHRGQPGLLLKSIKLRTDVCRGALRCMLGQPCLIPLLLEENPQWLYDFIVERCQKFDTTLLKCLFLWLNPLQDQLRPVMRDLKQGYNTIYTTRLQQLISTFMNVASTIDAREPCPEIHLETPAESETWKTQFVGRRSISCGLAHFAIVEDGNAKIVMADTPVNTEMIGRVLDVACGRHHTLVLTENGVYAAGDNSYGQLGVGRAWGGGASGASGAGGASGALLHVTHRWRAPVVAIAAGHYHSAAIDAGGRLYMWGWGVHGQLFLGSIEDKYTPQLVTKLQGRKICSVGLGACHSAARAACGAVWCAGAAVFGQLGGGTRDKTTLPLRLNLPPVALIHTSYFHNLALTHKGELFVWGGSPQQVRAAHAHRGAPADSPHAPPCHLLPTRVDLANVSGTIVQISAGWHHSCIVNNMGTVYTWGLNFDGQLGSGDRKQVQIPTEVRIRNDSQPESSKTNKQSMEIDENFTTKALVACGGDYTIYVDDDGKIYSTGNMHLQPNTALEKVNNKVIMMKTTKRVIKIPTSRSNKKFLFQPIDNINVMFPFDAELLERHPIDLHPNPMTIMKDFSKKSWADNMIIALRPWIKEEDLRGNLNMAAKFAFHNQMYAKSLKLQLDNLKSEPQADCLYLTHTEAVSDDITERSPLKQKTNLNYVVTNTVSKRIKEISLTILREQPYPVIDSATFKTIPCCCDELRYLKTTIESVVDISDKDLSICAANIIDKCIGMFPVDKELWETCFRYSKNYYLENNLTVTELERVLRKYMESNASIMADAILYSNDCTQYNEILTPKFYLNMCSEVLDTWG